MLAHPLIWFGCGVLFVVFAWMLGWGTRFMVGLFLDHPMVILRAEAEVGPETSGVSIREPDSRFLSRDGTELRGWMVRSLVPTRRVAVFFHEYGTDGSSWSRYLPWLPAEGFHVFTFDFRGSGQSSAPAGHRSHKWATAGEVADADAALGQVRARALAEGWDVFAFGASRGAAAMMMAAPAHPWLRVLACEGMSSTMGSIHSYMRRWARIWIPEHLADWIPDVFWRVMAHLVVVAAQDREGVRFPSLEEHLGMLTRCRALFIYGERDSLIDERQRKSILAAFAGERRSWILPKGGHLSGPVKFAVEYRSRLLEWFSPEPACSESAVVPLPVVVAHPEAHDALGTRALAAPKPALVSLPRA